MYLIWVIIFRIPGKRRETEICLTENGKTNAKQLLDCFYQAESRTMKEILKQYSSVFIDAVKYL